MCPKIPEAYYKEVEESFVWLLQEVWFWFWLLQPWSAPFPAVSLLDELKWQL